MRSTILVLLALLVAAPVTAAVRSVDGGIEFSHTDPGASSVSLAGEFNDWSTDATPMTDPDGDGTWSVVVPLQAGSYEYKFVVNGSTWVADPGNPRVSGDFGNSLVEVAADGSIVAGRAADAPTPPSGTPVISNTPLHSNVYMGGFFRMIFEGTNATENDPRLRLRRPDDQFNLDVTANLNPKVWGTLRLRIRTDQEGPNEIATELYRAQMNFEEERFAVKAFYNDEVFQSDDVFELLGSQDLRGTIREENRPFGQGLQGATVRLPLFPGTLEMLYADTYDEDIFNPEEPFLPGGDTVEEREGLNQSTETDVLYARYALPIGSASLGLSYRGELSDWWVNFNANNTRPEEIVEYEEGLTGRDVDEISDNYELGSDHHFVAIDGTLPLPRSSSLLAGFGYGIEDNRWTLGNREQLQGQTLANGSVDLPIGEQTSLRAKIGGEHERSWLRARVTHEFRYEEGMEADENQIVYRTQPGSVISDRSRTAYQPIEARYSDVNGADSVDVLRLGPAPELQQHVTELDLAADWRDFTLEFEFDRTRSNFEFARFADTGASASLDRWEFRTSPRLIWSPFQDEDRHFLALDTQFMQYTNPDEFTALGVANTRPAPGDEDGYGPAQGYGSLVAIESAEFVLRGQVPTRPLVDTPLDLRFNLRFIDYSGPEGLTDPEGNELDLSESFFTPFVALVYNPFENVEVQLGYGVDPRFYQVIDPQGWPNGRQLWRDDFLIDQRLDPYNPINVLTAEDAMADQDLISLNALVTF